MVKSENPSKTITNNSVYNASGLLSEQYVNDNPYLTTVKLYYNEAGQRVKKETFNQATHEYDYTTYYVHDVNGNLLAIYDNNNKNLSKSETPIYGTDRIGAIRGAKTEYELKDHLGNVRATFSPTNQESYADFFPFGYPLRSAYKTSKYRFGYQGDFAE